MVPYQTFIGQTVSAAVMWTYKGVEVDVGLTRYSSEDKSMGGRSGRRRRSLACWSRVMLHLISFRVLDSIDNLFVPLPSKVKYGRF
jgi:hypothetical protein